MKKMGTVKLLAVIFGAIVFMQLLCACGSDTKDVGKEAIKNTLECNLFFKKPEKNVNIITLFRGKEPVFPDVNEERQIVIDEIVRNYFGNATIDEKKKDNLVKKILNISNAIKYEIVPTGKIVKDGGINFREYIVQYEYPDFEKIYGEARKIVNKERASIMEREQKIGEARKNKSKDLNQLLCERINESLYAYYDKTFSDMENLPMKKIQAKHYIANIKDNIYAQDPMVDRLLNLQVVLDLNEVAPFLHKGNLNVMY